ncbi:tubulin-binding protein [[Actinobacillus] muris]|uniref:Tubulin-binding protein n=1 Tax=Muribacter muris TaxID=67855 RepID=A0A0J5P3W4_9PAST|nr:tubulin-binding protein [[Actinobacillus] muris] [Muribacter muris]
MTMQHEQTTTSAHSDTHEQTTPTAKKSKWRWLWRAIIGLILLLVLPLLFLTTATGQRTLLHWADKWVDGLTIGTVEGSLQEGLLLSDTQFQTDGVKVNVGQAELHIGFQCLWERRACIENMSLRDTAIDIDTAKLPPAAPKEEKPLGEIELPLGVALKQIALNNVSVKVDDMVIHLQHFQSGITGQGKQLNLEPTQLAGLTLSLPQAVENPQKSAKSTVSATQPIDWNALKAQFAEPLLTKLDPIKLPLNVNIADFSARDIRLERQTAESHESLLNVAELQLKAHSDEKSVALEHLLFKSDKGDLNGQGLLTLAKNYPLGWKLNANMPALPDFQLPASEAEMTLSGELFDATHLKLTTSGAINADLQGSVQLAEPKTPFNLALKSAAIRYPFISEKGQDPLQLKQVDLAIQGDLLDYRLDTQLEAAGMGVPKSALQLKGQGGLTHFNVADLTLNTLQGKAQLAGNIDWQTGVEWQSALQLNDIHTKSLIPEWAAVLSGALKSRGYVARGEKGEQWAVELSDVDLHGNLFQKRLQLTGALKADAQTLLNVPAANLIYGENRIELKGVIGDKSDFSADINAPNLKGLVPNFNAAVQGKVKMLGKLSEPTLDLDVSANNVSYEQFKFQHLTAKGNISSANEIKGDLTVGLRQFAYDDVKISNANLTASGSEANHQVKLIAQGEPVGANLQISGKFDRLQQRWQGKLQNVAIQSPAGEWKNEQAVAVAYHHSQLKADIGAHCWRNPNLQLCFPQAFSAGKEGKVPFELKRFDLAMVQPFLAKETQVAGIINANGTASWFADKAPQVNVELGSNSIKVVQQIDHRRFPIHLTPVKLRAKLADNQLNLQTDIQLEKNGRISSDLVMKDLANKRALSGKLNLEQLNLSVISPLLSAGEKVGGEINARLTLGGTALSPLLYGNLNLSALTARSNIMPFEVTGGGLSLNFNGATSTLNGNVQTKESNLVLEGDANWQKLEAWHTRIKARAERFRVDMPNMAKVDVSPNIEVKATPKALILSGKVDIPWARIAVEALPESAVAVSQDEVIMDGRGKARQKAAAILSQPPAQTHSGMAIQANIDINVGNDVKIDAYGLKSDLNGKVKVRQGDKGLGLYGQVNLQNGTFASFGQDLVIRKGLISFTGSPTQPTLDIEAIRNPEAIEDSKVTAGVKVTGIADAPEVKLFSTPSMPQDQILSYILTGRGLEGSGDAGSSNSIAAALIGMSLSKSSKMVGGVGSAFGINDLNVSTAGIGDNTKVVVSGSLTPKFRVKYGVGIFAPLTELTLRYRLAPNLYLQWVSSINQAVDLMYRFEFD